MNRGGGKEHYPSSSSSPPPPPAVHNQQQLSESPPASPSKTRRTKQPQQQQQQQHVSSVSLSSSSSSSKAQLSSVKPSTTAPCLTASSSHKRRMTRVKSSSSMNNNNSQHSMDGIKKNSNHMNQNNNKNNNNNNNNNKTSSNSNAHNFPYIATTTTTTTNSASCLERVLSWSVRQRSMYLFIHLIAFYVGLSLTMFMLSSDSNSSTSNMQRPTESTVYFFSELKRQQRQNRTQRQQNQQNQEYVINPLFSSNKSSIKVRQRQKDQHQHADDHNPPLSSNSSSVKVQHRQKDRQQEPDQRQNQDDHNPPLSSNISSIKVRQRQKDPQQQQQQPPDQHQNADDYNQSLSSNSTSVKVRQSQKNQQQHQPDKNQNQDNHNQPLSSNSSSPKVRQRQQDKELRQQPNQHQQQQQHETKPQAQQQQQQHALFPFDRALAEATLRAFGASSIRRPLTAYVEPHLQQDVLPNKTGNRGDFKNGKDLGTPPEFRLPLPARTITPSDLQTYSYPKLQTCHDLPARLPVDRGLVWEKRKKKNHSADSADGDDQSEYAPIQWNLMNDPTPDDFPQQEAPYCPVELDPFLPWIHDVFPSVTTDVGGDQVIEFIAQNKRLCRTGSKFTKDVNRLVPQVTHMQPVSVQRLSESEARRISPTVWSPKTTNNHSLLHDNNDNDSNNDENNNIRYRLAPRNESDPNGQNTRFICRFHATQFTTTKKGRKVGKPNPPKSVLIGETLSVYPFNYEFIAYRKSLSVLLTPKGQDFPLFWTSTIRFQCPVPPAVQQLVASGDSILSDGTATIYVDVIPIRTSVRYLEFYLSEDDIGPTKMLKSVNGERARLFDPTKNWGSNHVLPRVEASGRWENIPICWPPSLSIINATTTTTTTPPPAEATTTSDSSITSTLQQQQHESSLYPTNDTRTDNAAGGDSTLLKQNYDGLSNFGTNQSKKKPFYLSACLWSAASYKTRGPNAPAQSDTEGRLREWIEFHLLVGFDHFVIYDNSGAHTNASSLAFIKSEFPGKITYIEWPFVVCNNNIPAHDCTGHRSSQYAAENSCRTRLAPYTEWIAVFDTDEYLVPMGNYTSLREVLEHAEGEGTQILTFLSSRGLLRQDKSFRTINNRTKERFEKQPNATFLEAYNCDSVASPKPSWAERARKQVFRAHYVLYHFVHYSTVTQEMLQTYSEAQRIGERWHPTHKEFEAPIQRRTDDVHEAVMVHTKTILAEQMNNYRNICHKNVTKKWKQCFVAFPWPNGIATSEENKAYDADGMQYNCFMNEKVEHYWIPKLRVSMKKRAENLTGNQTIFLIE